MADLLYNFLDNNFTVYEPVETPKAKKFNMSPLLEPVDLPGFRTSVTTSGQETETPIAEDTFGIINNNPEEVLYSQPSVSRATPSKMTGNSLENGKVVINTLMSRLNLTKELAAGIAGVIMSESGLNPKAYNSREKAGKLKGSRANGAGYGAGMLQWSNERKNSALELIGKKGVNIETLPLEDQIEMIARELEGPYKNTLAGIRASRTASESAATMYCHNVAGFSRSSSPATQQEIDLMNKRYSKFGNSIINRGMSYAESLALL